MVNKVVVTTFSPLPFSYCSYYTVHSFFSRLITIYVAGILTNVTGGK